MGNEKDARRRIYLKTGKLAHRAEQEISNLVLGSCYFLVIVNHRFFYFSSNLRTFIQFPIAFVLGFLSVDFQPLPIEFFVGISPSGVISELYSPGHMQWPENLGSGPPTQLLTSPWP
jgi:hypothetical protein